MQLVCFSIISIIKWKFKVKDEKKYYKLKTIQKKERKIFCQKTDLIPVKCILAQNYDILSVKFNAIIVVLFIATFCARTTLQIKPQFDHPADIFTCHELLSFHILLFFLTLTFSCNNNPRRSLYWYLPV